MKITCPVSLGELVDKITILEIKMERIPNQEKVELARHEHQELTNLLDSLDLKDINEPKSQLKKINEQLWQIEDDIRIKEQKSEFDQVFIDLARSVYITNDARFEVKNSINLLYNCDIKEVKSYKG